jgi:demethylmenaquinone methyltransferase/2-methoxy-6-polyprenyl-1,4-benzoquinol methylase
MLKQNQKNAGVPLVQACGEFLPFRSGTFDFISMGYALRHVESLAVFFAELKRVLKPGGIVLLLEISRPESAVAFQFLKLYFGVLPMIARFRTNSGELRELLKYYWATIAECVPPGEITENLRGAGFNGVERKRLGPMLNDYLARKPV